MALVQHPAAPRVPRAHLDNRPGYVCIMLGRLLLLFVLVPLAELAILVRVGQAVGLWPTLALVASTGIAGAALARAQGLRAVRRLQTELAAGRVPGGAVLDGLGVLVGGAFLLTPGILTDVAGFLLLVPATRRWLRRRVETSLKRRIERGDLQLVVLDPRFAPPFGGAPSETSGVPDPDLDPRNEIRVDD